MKRNQLSVFATKVDLEGMLGAAIARHPLLFVEAGSSDDPASLKAVEVQDLTEMTAYLACDSDTEIAVRDVRQRNGATSYVVDQLKNPATVMVNVGGFAADRLLPSQIGTSTQDHRSLKILETIRKAVHDQSTKIGSFRVGQDAANYARSGTRLSPTAKSPPEYDLKIV